VFFFRPPAAEHPPPHARPEHRRSPRPAAQPSPPPKRSFDFLVLNLLGWVAYATFNVSIYFIFECPHAPRGPAPGQAAPGGLGAAAGGGGRHGGLNLVGGGLANPGMHGAVATPALGTTDFCQVRRRRRGGGWLGGR
jgi:hypothetical protein